MKGFALFALMLFFNHLDFCNLILMHHTDNKYNKKETVNSLMCQFKVPSKKVTLHLKAAASGKHIFSYKSLLEDVNKDR